MVDDQEANRRLEQFKSVARQAGIKLTHQRLEIFRAVASSEEHPSAEAVYNSVRTTMPTVSLDTVYRTLWMLTDLGLLTTLGPRQGSVRFEPNLAQHHHYLCDRCGKLLDFESPELDALKLPDAVNRLGQVVSAHVEVRGICNACTSATPEGHPDTTTATRRAQGVPDE